MAAAYGWRRPGFKAGLLALLLALAPVRGVAAASRTVLVLGDSLSAGYGLARSEGFQARLQAALAQQGLPVQILDGAVSGDTSAGGLARLDWTLSGTRPDAAIVELGGNDGLRGLPVSAMRRNLAAILDRLAALGVPVVLAGMYPPPNLGSDYAREFRAAFDALGRRPGLRYEPFFLQGVALHPALLQPDGIHPNAAGVAVVVAGILPYVDAALRKP